ncbi:hypothetical protein U1Q18_009603 [Sarracenia purpurea var. burkii]
MFDFSSRSRKEKEQNQQQLQKQLIIFYNGSISVYEVTELQASAILMLASEEMEERLKSLLGSTESEARSPLHLQSPLCSPTVDVSMKKSLQRIANNRRGLINHDLGDVELKTASSRDQTTPMEMEINQRKSGGEHRSTKERRQRRGDRGVIAEERGCTSDGRREGFERDRAN